MHIGLRTCAWMHPWSGFPLDDDARLQDDEQEEMHILFVSEAF